MAICPWPIDVFACCEDVGLDPNDPEDARKVDDIVAQVSEMLSRWSGYTFGGCRTVRPLDPCGSCRAGCCLSGDCIVLHDATGVTEVRMYGEIVDPDEYLFDPMRGILCAVPPLKWPTADPRFDAVGALEVDTMVGSQPDAWALATARELACELLLSCADSKKCRLPRNATTVSSQGVTISLSIDEIRYSLPSVIAWVNAVNPARATAPARVFSPEARAARLGAPPWRR